MVRRGFSHEKGRSQRRRTVQVIRPQQEPELINVRQELAGEPHLPGFRVAAAQLFM
jgi:Uma2 family endonuclease